MTPDELGSYPARPEGTARSDVVASAAETPERLDAQAPPASSPDAVEAAEAERRRRSRFARRVALALVVLFAAGVGMWVYATSTAPVSTPSLVSLTPADADKVLSSAHLRSGTARYRVTRDFPAGRIIAQSPGPLTQVAQGSLVNIQIAVAPKAVQVPDVVGAEASYAQNVLNYALFTPAVTYAYNASTASGEVVEQLPRAGDTAQTGSADVIVVSLGPGTPGATVPDVVGKTFVQASQIASAATLFAQPRPVIATGTVDGVIVDQAPSPGTLVPVGTNLWLSVADSRAGR